MSKQVLGFKQFVGVLIFSGVFSFCAKAQEVDDRDQINDSSDTIMNSDIPKNAPSFSQFSTTRFKGKLASPHIGENRRSKQYRTKIMMSAKQGINFAGHYNIAFWGCGIACYEVAIIDMKTGKIHHPKTLDSVTSYFVAGFSGSPSDINDNYIDTNIGLGFRPDSKLLIVAGPTNGATEPVGISYFLWQNDRLRLVRFVPKN